ncbi:transcription termination factor 5, mitochondrial [Condylostylus longicornis]|uniref:transcription termination factor 5, mitochondrial n=1 Tax=Condylostylus longicornis TaxID=2530218 RepID=UPI00244E3CF2|nr:transcription termination factor 5, mitochondrial [Condylostylus longicornis]
MHYNRGVLRTLSSFKYFVRSVNSNSKNLTTQKKPPNIYFLSNILGSSPNKCAKILEENEKLFDVSRKDITKTTEFLKSLEFTVGDIESKPMILYVNAATLENRYETLLESGCDPVTISILFKYVTIMNKEVSVLKKHKIIRTDFDVQHQLEKIFDSDVKIKLNEKLDEQLPLRVFREKILNAYLVEKFHFNKSQLERQWKVYGRIRHRSFKSILKMVNILTEELNFPLERIIKNGYLIYGDPENLRKLLEIPKIGSENFKDILFKRPKIIMSSYESVYNTIKHIRDFGIPDESILKCPDILTLGSNTVQERLNELKNIDELQVLISNPRILRLVHYQNKALQRLDYLNNMRVKCVSLHILSCDSEAFVRFVREGTDKNKGKDLLVYLANIFNSTQKYIRDELSKHSNWSHITVLQVKECLELLQANNFNLSDIFPNIHILLYPKHKIEEKLKILQTDEFYKENQLNTSYTYVSYKQILTLCLYLMEIEFHFTGDGVWADQYSNNVENFNNLIPDFLESKNNLKRGESVDNNIKSEAIL